MSDLRETIARAIETTRATIERDIPAEQRGMVVASSLALADAVLAIPEIAEALEYTDRCKRFAKMVGDDVSKLELKPYKPNLGHSITVHRD